MTAEELVALMKLLARQEMIINRQEAVIADLRRQLDKSIDRSL